MKDLGEPENFLGIEIFRDRKKKVIKMVQSEYIQKCLERFNMKDCKPCKTPMVTRQVRKRECANSEENQRRTDVPFKEAIGSLLYLAGATRPDITYSVNYLARKQVNPSETDWKEVKRICRYLQGTSNLGLTFRAKGDNLQAMTDASFRDCNDSTSTGGYVVQLFDDPIAWRSRKQNYVSLSTCQAETLAMSDVCQELVSLDKAIRDMIGKTNYPVTIWCDNKSAVDCTQMDGSHKMKNFDDTLENIQRDLKIREKTGSKVHMSVTHGDYIKLCTIEGKVKAFWICTSENEADIMTKPLPINSHEYLRDKIMNNTI